MVARRVVYCEPHGVPDQVEKPCVTWIRDSGLHLLVHVEDVEMGSEMQKERLEGKRAKEHEARENQVVALDVSRRLLVLPCVVGQHAAVGDRRPQLLAPLEFLVDRREGLELNLRRFLRRFVAVSGNGRRSALGRYAAHLSRWLGASETTAAQADLVFRAADLVFRAAVILVERTQDRGDPVAQLAEVDPDHFVLLLVSAVCL
mmetsp:Transcript_86742/g.250556  ORF Transcript_86742/g.250556 Transcript_86742/m.250556 type:complete len:203 (+) Transcript_86742:168-776(+)